MVHVKRCKILMIFTPILILITRDLLLRSSDGVTLQYHRCLLTSRRYSWGHLVVPYTEELISWSFVDEN